MVIKLSCVLFLFWIYCVQIQAQQCVSYGIQAGITQNELLTNISNRPYLSYKSRFGFVTGLPVKYQFCRNWTINSGIDFIEKSYRLDYAVNSALYQNVNNYYMQLPLCVSYTVNIRKFKFNLTGGGYAAYWLESFLKGNVANLLNTNSPTAGYSEFYVFNKEQDRRFEFGSQVGIGTPVLFSRFSANFDWYRSLTDQQKQYMIMMQQLHKYNSTLLFSIGWYFKKSNHEK